VSGPWALGCKETETEWKMEVEGDVCYVAFKGSTSLMDWKQNFSILPKLIRPYKSSEFRWYVSSGIFDKFNSVAFDIKKLIDDLKPKRIEVYGFSQGGAVAKLCCEWLWFNYKDIAIEVHTYNAQKVIWFWNKHKLNNRFEKLNCHIIRRDIVWRVPFWWLLYLNVGKLIKYGKFGISFPWNWKKTHMSFKEYV